MKEYSHPVAKSTQAFNQYEENIYGDAELKEPEINIHK